jgi:outer membrane protein assembly factor BamB
VTLGTTICCSALALIVSAAGLRSATGEPDEDTISPSLLPAQPMWTLALNSGMTVAPAYDAARVFFSLDGDRIVAYDIHSGTQRWLVEAAPAFQPATGEGMVFFATGEAITALRADDGSVAWSLPIPKPLSMRPVWDNGWLIGVTDAGTVLALRARDGHLVWQQDVGAAAHAAPVLAADRIYIAAANGRVVTLNVADGSLVWERKIGGVPNDLLAVDGRLYVGSTDNYFYCLLVKDGKIDWRWRTGADVIGVPVADERRVYFVSLDNVLRGMNLVSGAQEWMRPLPMRPTFGPLLAGSTLVVAGQSPTLRTFEAKDGTPAADIDAGDEVTAQPHVLPHPLTSLPMLLVTTRNLAKGSGATLIARTIEPTLVPAVAPLANPVTPVRTPSTP